MCRSIGASESAAEPRRARDQSRPPQLRGDLEPGPVAGPVLAVLALEPIALFQMRASGVPVMKRRYHFGNTAHASLTEMARVSALIGDLDRRAQLLECDITAEEKRVCVSNRSDDAYPIAARILAVRRDNLKATITTLEQQLASLKRTEQLPA